MRDGRRYLIFCQPLGGLQLPTSFNPFSAAAHRASSVTADPDSAHIHRFINVVVHVFIPKRLIGSTAGGSCTCNTRLWSHGRSSVGIQFWFHLGHEQPSCTVSLPHLTSSFAAVINTTVTRGRCLTTQVSLRASLMRYRRDKLPKQHETAPYSSSNEIQDPQ